MKKHILITVSVLVISVLMAIPSQSATVDVLVGTWNTFSKPKLKISGIGSRSAENYGTVTLDQLATFNLHEVDTYFANGLVRTVVN